MIPDRSGDAAALSPPRTIAVGFDGSDDAVSALDWALGFAEASGASVVVVHAVGLLEHGEERRIANEIRRQVGQISLAHPGTGDVRIDIAPGDPCSVLVSSCAPPIRADLVVVGSRGRGLHKGSALGSTSLSLAERSQVPLVVVPRGSTAI
jgi:nucleotide-binding universal stress UspA family protein